MLRLLCLCRLCLQSVDRSWLAAPYCASSPPHGSPVSMFSSTMHSPVSSTQSQGSVPGTTAITSPGTSAVDGTLRGGHLATCSHHTVNQPSQCHQTPPHTHHTAPAACAAAVSEPAASTCRGGRHCSAASYCCHALLSCTAATSWHARLLSCALPCCCPALPCAAAMSCCH